MEIRVTGEIQELATCFSYRGHAVTDGGSRGKGIKQPAEAWSETHSVT